jgi:hypothetical protein
VTGRGSRGPAAERTGRRRRRSVFSALRDAWTRGPLPFVTAAQRVRIGAGTGSIAQGWVRHATCSCRGRTSELTPSARSRAGTHRGWWDASRRNAVVGTGPVRIGRGRIGPRSTDDSDGGQCTVNKRKRNHARGADRVLLRRRTRGLDGVGLAHVREHRRGLRFGDQRRAPFRGTRQHPRDEGRGGTHRARRGARSQGTVAQTQIRRKVNRTTGLGRTIVACVRVILAVVVQNVKMARTGIRIRERISGPSDGRRRCFSQ